MIEKLIADNEKVRLAWDQAVRREHGGAYNRDGIGGKSGKQPNIVKLDNIQLDNKPGKPAESDRGTSANIGLRRLDKAAKCGEAKAAELLRRHEKTLKEFSHIATVAISSERSQGGGNKAKAYWLTKRS